MRAIVLAPTFKDGRLTQRIFERHGVQSALAATLGKACAMLDAGAALLLLAEEDIATDAELRFWLSKQETWSDLPLLVMARTGADSMNLARISETYGNVTILERPMRISALVSATRSAIRARQRQYQIRDYLRERENSEYELKENDRRKDEFLAILAHELRNPLAPVCNALSILKLSQSADAQVAYVGQMMERQVGNLKRLVEDLLEVSRITRGEVTLKKEPADLNAILVTAIEASKPLFEAGGVRLEADIPRASIHLNADVVRIAQVFTNVLNNAAKYTHQGGRALLSVKQAPGEVAIGIRDNGAGIPLEMQSKIFELFTQVDQHLDRAQGGLGIGLTLVKRLVQLHEGKIQVLSDGLGKGSEFTITLPTIDPPGPLKCVEPTSEAEAPLSDFKLLIVDDNQDAAESLGIVLETLGASVSIAYTGESALQLLARWKADAAILDIGMEDMDGLTLARTIRAVPELSDMMLIALTGFGQDQHTRATKEAGFDAHLVKPVAVDSLQSLLSDRFKARIANS